MKRTTLAASLALFLAGGAWGRQAAPLDALARLPVKELTVFKDGHAFVLHEGTLPVDASGDVRMDYLPTPVLGTFWPFSSRKEVPLKAVVASPRRVMVERTALTMREIMEANPGIRLDIAKTDGSGFTDLQIVGVPTRSSEELEATAIPGADSPLPQKADFILLKGAEGVFSMPFSALKHVTFKGDPKLKLAQEEVRNLLTLKLAWPGGRAERTAPVGMAYLQKGFRWIPGYRITIDGKGAAQVELQATLINELADVRDATANLVVGVPTFAFKDTLDPIGLQETLTRLSRYFDDGAQTGRALSNAIMSQAARMGDFRAEGAAGPRQPNLGPEVGGADRNEDLYVYTVKNVTLGKGERMVMPVTEAALKYRDVYVVDIPFAAPPEVRANVNTEQQAELARLFGAPTAEHRIRISNSGKHPFTTAPALILNQGRVMAQNLLTYTAVGGESDLKVTTATDIRVKKEEKETGRVPNALEFQGDRYLRVNMTGTVTLTNYKAKPVEVEVKRHILGHTDQVNNNGVSQMLNWFETAGAVDARPYWWGWYSWPGWWINLNGLGQFRWTVKLEPGKSVDLGYAWHYFTR